MGRPALVAIAEYHNDLVAALGMYFRADSPDLVPRFAGYTPEEVRAKLSERLEETDLRSAFVVLTIVEAAFRLDYEQRCRRKLKDDLSRIFRGIYKVRRNLVRLDIDILEPWTRTQPGSRKLISELRGALRSRDWFAHGRYWEPRLGNRKYDFNFVYGLAEDVFSNLELYDLN